MVVTGTEELTKSRSKVFIDGEFAFVLYRGELTRFHIRPGEEIAKEEYDLIKQEILPKRARIRAMKLLLKKDYTTSQLRGKLQKGGYPEDIIEDALDYVASFHYTDDLRYALDFINCHQHTRSRMRMEQDLRARGIPQDVLEEAWQQWEQDGGMVDEPRMIAELMRKRGFDSETASVGEKQREYAFFMRKGFSGENVRKAVFGRNDIWMD